MPQKYKVFINNSPKIINDNWERFCSDYKIIYASGGVVINSHNEVLMIYRNGMWDLPKGKREVGESDKECALREVVEECGLTNLSLNSFLKKTYHTYELNGESILKITSWFLMHSDFRGIFIPQTTEGIIDVKWVNKNNLDDYAKNTFGNIAEILLEL